MQYAKFDSAYIVRIDRGEELVATLTDFCRNQSIRLGSVSGLGATNDVTIGLFETEMKTYHSTRLQGNHEITHLSGNISTKEGDVYLHLHATLSDKTYHAFGGHLNSAIISGTCEIHINVIDGQVERAFNKDIGLNLYKFM